MRRPHRLVLVGVLCLLPLLAPPRAAAEESQSGLRPVPAALSSYPALFGTREVFSSDTAAFYKWTGMLARFEAERARATHPCPRLAVEGCEPSQWRELVRELRDLPPLAKLQRVNAEINRYPYVPSMRNWGESNHWETPFEFFRKSGQCQDYAITKYMLLREAGVPAEHLRLLVLHDTRLGLDHAVIVAYVDGTAYLLDNQLRDVVPADSVHHYQPYYSINERGWWLHRGGNARYAAAAGGETAH